VGEILSVTGRGTKFRPEGPKPEARRVESGRWGGSISQGGFLGEGAACREPLSPPA